MAKYTLIPLIFALIPISGHASTMSMKERMAIGARLEKVAPFVREKYLPGSFVKELEKNLQSKDDKAEFKKIQGQWSKNYSKDVNFRSVVNSFEITYKKVPVVSVKVTSVNPYTIKVNNGSEMIIRKGSFFADMSEALKDAGYDFSAKKKKSAFFSYILPEAYAEGATAKTVENSIFILGLSTFAQREDGSLAPATIATENMAAGGGFYPGVDQVSCRGDRMQGKYTQGPGQYGAVPPVNVDFVTSREMGVKMAVGDYHIVGKRVASAATQLCQAVDQGIAVDLTNEKHMLGYSKHRAACLYLQSVRPAAGLVCSENGAAQPSQDVFKAECAAMREVGLSIAFEFYVCKDSNCKDSEMTKLPAEIQNTRQLAAWQKFVPELEAAKKAVRDAFSSEMHSTPAQVKEVDGVFSIVPPDKMSASRSSEFLRLVKKIPTAPTEDKAGVYFDFGFGAIGFVGLLDCCYDTECKAKVYERGRIELVPADGVH